MASRVVGVQRKQHLNGRTVWMIIPSYFPMIGGAEIQARLLSRNLQQNNLDVRILTRKLNRHTASRTIEDGVEVIRIPGVGITPIDSIIFLFAGLWYLFKKKSTPQSL